MKLDMQKKIILKILGGNDKNIKLRKIWGVVLVGCLTVWSLGVGSGGWRGRNAEYHVMQIFFYDKVELYRVLRYHRVRSDCFVWVKLEKNKWHRVVFAKTTKSSVMKLEKYPCYSSCSDIFKHPCQWVDTNIPSVWGHFNYKYFCRGRLRSKLSSKAMILVFL